jgi:hypothetical protein
MDEEKNDKDAVALILKAMWESDELIKLTNVTQSIKKSLEKLMALENDKKLLLQSLFKQLQRSFCEMCDSVKKFRLLSVKKDKLSSCFTNFLLKMVLICVSLVTELWG